VDIFFQDPSDIPLPPEEVHIRKLNAEPWPDGQRVRIYLEISPFQIRPNGEISVTDSNGEEVASLSIVETIDPKMEMTIHLRGRQARGEYTVSATIFYAEHESEDDQSRSTEEEMFTLPTKIRIVDQASTTFTIAA
jgi:hypothetical protein